MYKRRVLLADFDTFLRNFFFSGAASGLLLGVKQFLSIQGQHLSCLKDSDSPFGFFWKLLSEAKQNAQREMSRILLYENFDEANKLYSFPPWVKSG